MTNRLSKLWLVARNEWRRHTQKRSFPISLLSLPLIILIAGGVALLLGNRAENPMTVIGYIDEAGLLTTPLPSTYEADHQIRLVPFESEAAAQAAMDEGTIPAYFLLPAGDLSGNQAVLYYREEVGEEAIGAFLDLVRINLVSEQPPEIARRVLDGNDLITRLPDGREFDGTFNLGYILPVLAGLALVVLIFFGSGYLMQAITEEKANRTMEILVTSLSPGQLLQGKIVGITAVNFVQLATWAAFTVVAAIVGRNYIGAEWLSDLRVDPGMFLLLLALIVPAYLLVASLVTTIGATLVEPRGSQQVMGAFLSLYMVPLGLIAPLLNNLSSPLAVALSVIPFTAPVFLPLRATFAYVPTWQIVAIAALQFLCALGALWLAGRALRLGMLRYGRTLRLGEILGWSRPAGRQGAGARPHPSPRTGAISTATIDKRGRNKVFVILRHELAHIITRPWFILMLFGLPLLIFGQMFFFNQTIADSTAGPGAAMAVDATVDMPTTALPHTFGYVDPAGFIDTIPAQVPAGTAQAYPDEASARQALEAGTIASFFIIPAGYVESGELIQARSDFSPLNANPAYGWMSWTLLVNLLDNDVALASQIWNPLEIEATAATPTLSAEAEAAAQEELEDQERLTTMLIMLLFYAVIIMVAGFLLRTVSEEKKNRTIEVLLLSASTEQILLGKTIGLGLAGLLQAVGWGLIGYLLFTLGGAELRLPASMTFSLEFIVGATVFFLLGYAIYATLYAGAGALVPNWREAQGISFLIILPALIGFEISLFQADTPHSALMVAASIFPLTAPFTMIKRLLHGGVPLWQLLLAVALMIGATYLITRAVARMFHALNLLSGQPLSVRRYLKALLGQEP